MLLGEQITQRTNFNDPTTKQAPKINLFNSTAQDYVESLHQNNKVVLLYGKNNVLVQSVIASPFSPFAYPEESNPCVSFRALPASSVSVTYSRLYMVAPSMGALTHNA